MLLQEEGSSVAFPEAVEQMRDNMLEVAHRLEAADTGDTTQIIEQLIVETLEEMIFALQKEMEKLKQQEGEPPPPGEPQDPPLVDLLAELKMIRSLQNQINRLTRAYRHGVRRGADERSRTDSPAGGSFRPAGENSGSDLRFVHGPGGTRPIIQ